MRKTITISYPAAPARTVTGDTKRGERPRGHPPQPARPEHTAKAPQTHPTPPSRGLGERLRGFRVPKCTRHPRHENASEAHTANLMATVSATCET